MKSSKIGRPGRPGGSARTSISLPTADLERVRAVAAERSADEDRVVSVSEVFESLVPYLAEDPAAELRARVAALENERDSVLLEFAGFASFVEDESSRLEASCLASVASSRETISRTARAVGRLVSQKRAAEPLLEVALRAEGRRA